MENRSIGQSFQKNYCILFKYVTQRRIQITFKRPLKQFDIFTNIIFQIIS